MRTTFSLFFFTVNFLVSFCENPSAEALGNDLEQCLSDCVACDSWNLQVGLSLCNSIKVARCRYATGSKLDQPKSEVFE